MKLPFNSSQGDMKNVIKTRLRKLELWAARWGMEFNILKCKVMEGKSLLMPIFSLEQVFEDLKK